MIPFKVLLAELDAVAKQRLTPEQMAEIVNAPRTPTVIRDFAKKFKVREPLIRHVRYTYKHLRTVNATVNAPEASLDDASKTPDNH